MNQIERQQTNRSPSPKRGAQEEGGGGVRENPTRQMSVEVKQKIIQRQYSKKPNQIGASANPGSMRIGELSNNNNTNNYQNSNSQQQLNKMKTIRKTFNIPLTPLHDAKSGNFQPYSPSPAGNLKNSQVAGGPEGTQPTPDRRKSKNPILQSGRPSIPQNNGVSFFDSLIQRDLLLQIPDTKIQQRWEQIVEQADVISLMDVRTNSMSLMAAAGQRAAENGAEKSLAGTNAQGGPGLGTSPNVGDTKNMNTPAIGDGDQWPSGEARTFICLLAEEYLFLIPQKPISEFSPTNRSKMALPKYYLNIEFAKLYQIRDQRGNKTGFLLAQRDIQHEFMMKALSSIVENKKEKEDDPRKNSNGEDCTEQFNHNSPIDEIQRRINAQNGIGQSNQIFDQNLASPYMQDSAIKQDQQRSPDRALISKTNQQTNSMFQQAQFRNMNQKVGTVHVAEGAGGQMLPMKKRKTFHFESDKLFENMQSAAQQVKDSLKVWITALNNWVIRSENLKKYHVVQEIGSGGQAKVYKVTLKNELLAHQRNKAGQPLDKKFTMGGSCIATAQGKQFNNAQQSESGLNVSDCKSQVHVTPAPAVTPDKSKPVCRYFAMKVINKGALMKKSSFEQKQMIREIQMQRRLRHCGNTIKLHKIYESDSFINMLMEFQEGGTLSEALSSRKKLTEDEGKEIMAQILLTIDFMCRLGIVHRDLKPDNILLNSKDDKTYDIRLADFGFAAKIKNSQKKPTGGADDKILCGTPGYICPEAINGDGFTLKSDLFCAGAIMFAILTLKHFFNGNSYKDIMRANGQCNLEQLDERMQGFSSESRDLVRQLMCKDPAKRPTAAIALGHAWFQNEYVPIQNSLGLNKLLARNKFQMCGNEFQARFHKLMSQVSQDFSMKQPALGGGAGAAIVSGLYGNQSEVANPTLTRDHSKRGLLAKGGVVNKESMRTLQDRNAPSVHPSNRQASEDPVLGQDSQQQNKSLPQRFESSQSPRKVMPSLVGNKSRYDNLVQREPSNNLNLFINNGTSSQIVVNNLTNQLADAEQPLTIEMLMNMNYYHILRSYKGDPNAFGKNRADTIRASPSQQSLAKVFGFGQRNQNHETFRKYSANPLALSHNKELTGGFVPQHSNQAGVPPLKNYENRTSMQSMQQKRMPTNNYLVNSNINITNQNNNNAITGGGSNIQGNTNANVFKASLQDIPHQKSQFGKAKEQSIIANVGKSQNRNQLVAGTAGNVGLDSCYSRASVVGAGAPNNNRALAASNEQINNKQGGGVSAGGIFQAQSVERNPGPLNAQISGNIKHVARREPTAQANSSLPRQDVIGGVGAMTAKLRMPTAGASSNQQTLAVAEKQQQVNRQAPMGNIFENSHREESKDNNAPAKFLTTHKAMLESSRLPEVERQNGRQINSMTQNQVLQDNNNDHKNTKTAPLNDLQRESLPLQVDSAGAKISPPCSEHHSSKVREVKRTTDKHTLVGMNIVRTKRRFLD